MEMVICLIVFWFGAVFGSFLCCQARRLKLKEKGKKLSKRSECLKCGYRLAWYDNIPIISWLMLGGRCRKCNKKIGVAEILSELGVGVLFVGFYFFYKDIIMMVGGGEILVICAVIFGCLTVLALAFLAIYDGIYGELPQAVLTFVIICAIIAVILRKWCLFSFGLVGNGGGIGQMSGNGGIFGAFGAFGTFRGGIGGEIINVLAGVGVFAGMYFLLYKISKERWVGAGDWQVAMAIALLVGDFYLALLCVFMANFLASVVMLPVIKIKKRKNTKVYFGPWMVAGMVVVMLMSEIVMKFVG